ncbi:MAG: hypothetical protein AABX34_04135, partial [Nanoarchaeota archaeon]
NGVWSDVDYCSKCGNKDFSCGFTCQNDVCDTTVNRWCDAGSWSSFKYCDRCGDSECLETCTGNACDVNAKKWCNNGVWSDVDYCSKCGNKDFSCMFSCEENTCDTTSNKRCLDGIWTSNSYCDYCGLADSDCTIVCAEGECDTRNKKVCKDSKWNSTLYEALCASPEINISIRSCKDYGNCTTGSSCISNNECASGFCSNGKCAEPSCNDDIKNGLEPDADCGGNCGKCANDKSCNANSDCVSNTCSDGTCAEADTCKDGILNADESDIDCGGTCSNKCSITNNCISNQDCGTGLECTSNLCSKKQAEGEISAETIDTDNDGIPDEWEIRHGLNANDMSDSNLDFDDDGLANIREYTLGTNPNNADSDGDGTSDKEEIEKDTNPADPVSKPGGIAGLLIWTIVIIIALGGGSYGIYYYKDYIAGIIGPKAQEPGYPASMPTQYRPVTTLKKPQKDANIMEIVRERRAEKERKRSKILEAFGVKPKIEDARTLSGARTKFGTRTGSGTPQGGIPRGDTPSVGKPVPREKQKEDVFSELKSISKNKKE